MSIEFSGASHGSLPFKALANADCHVVRQPSEGQSQIHKEVLSAAVKEDIHGSARDDFDAFILTHFCLDLSLKPSVDCLDETGRKRVPRLTFKLSRFVFNQDIPNIRNEEQMPVMALGNKAQHLGSCGVSEQWLREGKRCACPPF
jgi:hypothetical protein